MKWLIAAAGLFVGAFSVFGFLATFEPGVSGAMAFRIGYSLIGLISLAAVAFPFLRRHGR